MTSTAMNQRVQQEGKGLSKGLGMRMVAAAGLLALSFASSGYGRGVTSVMAEAGIERNSLTYFKVLSSLNIRPFITPAESGVGDAFKVCKRRWLSSPYGTWAKLTTVADVKSTMTSGDNRIVTSAVVTELVNSIGEDSFDMTITVTTSEGESEQNRLVITRNDYVVTCLEAIEKQKEMDQLLKIRYEHEEPYLANHEVESVNYRILVNTVSIKGNFPDGGKFQEQNSTGSAHFWAYSKGLNNKEASIVTDKSGTIQGIMQLETLVNYAYTSE